MKQTTKNVENNGEKIRLSFSMMNELINEPHTYLNRVLELPRYTSQAMKDGKKAHQIIQSHVCGKTRHPLLADLPTFEIVELEDRDPRTKIEYEISDKYTLVGYFDGYDPKTGRLLEVKTGRRWTPLDFSRLMQWRLYLLGLPEAKTVYLVNTPRIPEEWNMGNIKIFKTTVVKNDRKNAEEFINRAIYVIENIDKQNLYPEKKSYWCNYINCGFCPKGGELNE